MEPKDAVATPVAPQTVKRPDAYYLGGEGRGGGRGGGGGGEGRGGEGREGRGGEGRGVLFQYG